MDEMKCPRPKCKGVMKDGIALDDDYDIPEVIDDGRTGRPTMVEKVKTGTAKIIDVSKCKDCGHSILRGYK